MPEKGPQVSNTNREIIEKQNIPALDSLWNDAVFQYRAQRALDQQNTRILYENERARAGEKNWLEKGPQVSNTNLRIIEKQNTPALDSL